MGHFITAFLRWYDSIWGADAYIERETLGHRSDCHCCFCMTKRHDV